MLPSSLRSFAIFSIVATLLSALPTKQDGAQFHQIGSNVAKRATSQDYLNYAVAGINQMQTWYSAADGLYNTYWWPSANVITMLADFQDCYPAQGKAVTSQVFSTTLAQAQTGVNGHAGFLNGFYDDELWWALAWIKAFDVTGERKYLSQAAAIFEDAKAAFGNTTNPKTCGGGLWWDKANTYVNAVANELYLTTAAKLANRLPATPSQGYYYNQAVASYTWFVKSGMIGADNTINDGLDATTCKSNSGAVFSYNQGIILSGLAELTWASGDPKYNVLANTIATAAIAKLTDANGILHELCEPSACNGDEEQFKGVFGRNIQFLVQRANVLPAATATLYKNFLLKNADSIWASDQVNDQLGLVWSGPTGTVSVQTQSSALDVIVAAACISK